MQEKSLCDKKYLTIYIYIYVTLKRQIEDRNSIIILNNESDFIYILRTLYKNNQQFYLKKKSVTISLRADEREREKDRGRKKKERKNKKSEGEGYIIAAHDKYVSNQFTNGLPGRVEKVV